MDFNPETEGEVIRDAVSHKLNRHLVNPPNKFCRDSTQTKAPTSSFQIGDSIIYTSTAKREMVEMVDLNKNYPDSIKYINKLLRGNTMVVTKEFLKSRNVPNIGWI